jgi:hypothetical protein
MNAWHDSLAISLVLAAGGFVAWRAWLALVARRSAGCGSGCGKCPSGAAKPVMQIESAALNDQCPSPNDQ